MHKLNLSDIGTYLPQYGSGNDSQTNNQDDISGTFG